MMADRMAAFSGLSSTGGGRALGAALGGAATFAGAAAFSVLAAGFAGSRSGAGRAGATALGSIATATRGARAAGGGFTTVVGACARPAGNGVNASSDVILIPSAVAAWAVSLGRATTGAATGAGAGAG